MRHHQPLSVWFTYLYLMGLSVSNRQIAEELGLNESDGQLMADLLRGGIVERRPKVQMKGIVECDEVYIIAEHKGKPDKIKGRGADYNAGECATRNHPALYRGNYRTGYCGQHRRICDL